MNYAIMIYLSTDLISVLLPNVFPPYSVPMHYTKQLLDEAEHDIKNYSDRGQCYLPKRR
jgi:hypothetical protein